jgi:hypothetical protein
MMQAVDYIFTQCAAVYGSAWDRSLGQAPITDIKTAWLNAVDPFRASKKRIVWALQNLPERCPNAVEFRNLCRQAPMPEELALPGPKADPARVAAELAKLGLRPKVNQPHGMKQWAHRLKERHDAGDKLNPNQIRCYQAALGEVA